MKDDTRPVVAAIAGAMVNNRSYSSVYDFAAGVLRTIRCAVRGDHVEVYDFDKAAHISGNLPSGVYHFGDSGFLEIRADSSRFNGYDYLTGQFFEGTVSGNDIILYDYGSATFYNYSLS